MKGLVGVDMPKYHVKVIIEGVEAMDPAEAEDLVTHELPDDFGCRKPGLEWAIYVVANDEPQTD